MKTKAIAIRNNSGKWNHLKIIQTIPEQHFGKARNQGTTENSHVGERRQTAERTNVKYKTLNTGNNITCNINCNYRTTATVMYLKQTRFVSGTLL